MQTVPIQASASQSLQVQLDAQSCTIDIFQNAYGLFVDLYLDGAPVVLGVIALNLNRIVRSAYLGFVGDLVFFDTEGASDPIFTGLGTRYLLLYLTPDEVAAGLS